ncbi:MAG TPA: serine/threonine-protein kinase [Polyangiaceae bacterium]|jgi:serine/threonine-protein kinase
MTVLTGSLLGGRYRVGRKLGTGGMGAVYEGVQEDLARAVALKVLHPHLAADEELRGRFRREAHVVARLGHPNVVQISDFQLNEGEPPFLVMELLHGESLRDLLTRMTLLPPERVAYIAVQALSALEAAHRANVVHRDVKPDNIFLERTSVQADIVKVLDFGVAKLLGDDAAAQKLTRQGLVVGTLAYMSPEQALGDPIDGRADLYSLAAVMYLALAGKKPFDGATTAALLRGILNDRPVPLVSLRPEVGEELSRIVDRALAKRPSDRFASADEMAHALAPFALPTPLEVEPVVTLRTPTEVEPPKTLSMAAPFDGGTTAPMPRTQRVSYAAVAPTIPMQAMPAPRRARSVTPWIVSAAALFVILLLAGAALVAALHPWHGVMGSN